MIKDLTLIREALVGYAEVEMPYDFLKDCHIQYVTMMNKEEVFSKGGKFVNRCNDILVLQNNGLEIRVPICKRNKEGEVVYESRFFISEDTPDELIEELPAKTTQELTETIHYQQSIIEKLIERVKEVELLKHELSETISTYEDLLHEGRYKLKELSVEVREKTKKLDHYEELIPKLYNSR